LSNNVLHGFRHLYDTFDTENMTNVNSRMKIIGV